MSLATRKRRSAARQMLDLARRRGDGGVALLPGVSQSGMHWLARDCGLGVSLTPTAGTLGPDSVTRPSAAWLAAYVESTASTPAAVDGPVGFLSDGEGTVGAELFGSSSATLTGTTGPVITGPNIVAGQTYKLTYTYALTSGSIQAGPLTGAATQTGAVSGTYTAYLIANASTTGQIYSAGAVGTISNASLKQVTGRHATQNSGPNKPTMRRGLVNLLTYSNDLTNAVWAKGAAGSVVTGQADPYGGTSGIAIYQASSALDQVLKNIGTTIPAGSKVTVATIVKAGTYSSVRLALVNAGSTQFTQVTADLTTGVITQGNQLGGYLVSSFSSVSIGNGFWLIAVNVTTATDTSVDVWVGPSSSGSGVIAGTVTNYITAYRTGLFVGTLTASQIQACGGIPLTTTIAASSSGGNYALEFGGSVTQLQASFAPTNAATVVLAVRVNSFAGTPVLVGQAAGGLQVYINSGGGVQAGIAGGTNFGSANGVITAGAVYVISVRIAVNGTSTIRVNGVVVATSTAITAAMNQTTISIGSNGSSNFTGGLFGPVLLYTSVLSDAETLVLERGAGALAPITGVKF